LVLPPAAAAAIANNIAAFVDRKELKQLAKCHRLKSIIVKEAQLAQRRQTDGPVATS
jgi:hypothetical protein